MKILIIEDDKKISNFIKQGLIEESITVDQAFDGLDGLYLAEINPYDVLIVDRMLPEVNGLDIIRRLRSQKILVPILMLTARGDIIDRVEGIEAGADDYLTKPFSFAELVVRIKALHRRKSYEGSNELVVDSLKLDPVIRSVSREEQSIALTSKEFQLLEYLMRNKNRIVSKSMIIENIWSTEETQDSNVVNVTMYHLRKKVDQEYPKKLIKTIRGSGYRIDDH